MTDDGRLWLVWSNEHGAWWRGDGRGYTRVLNEAGRWSKDMADDIVDQATQGGRVTVTRETWAGTAVEVPPEVAVPAPEEPGRGAVWVAILRPFTGEQRP